MSPCTDSGVNSNFEWIVSRVGAQVRMLPMMTSPNGSIFRVTGPLGREFTGHRWIPRTKASDVELWYFLWSAPESRLSKQSWDWWLETPSGSLWRHCIASESQRHILLLNAMSNIVTTRPWPRQSKRIGTNWAVSHIDYNQTTASWLWAGTILHWAVYT